MNRRIARAKRQRLDDSDGMENDRTFEPVESFENCISPESICEPPQEETLVLSPVKPISIDFGILQYSRIDCDYEEKVLENQNKVIDEEKDVGIQVSEHDDLTIVDHADMLIPTNMDVKCPNCDRVMESANHMCDDVPVAMDISSEKHEETDEEFENRMAKFEKVFTEVFKEMWKVEPP